jgi:crotonobetainyl-CoA:carnitine CoA-transferase CaiB-like acyl-CoA transferase
MVDASSLIHANKPQPQPLSGVRVLDLSRVLAGPWASQLLGDFGAEVIKIERPGQGDETRHWGPPFIQSSGESTAAYYLCANRNKQSVAIDWHRPEGLKIVRDLASRCDIVIENFKVGTLAQYGLDYTSLSSEHPQLIYCSITGFGQTGPQAHQPGYDFLIQGSSGLMSVTGQAPNTPGAEPLKTGVAVSDLFTGLYASQAILAAWIHRQNTGQGQWIDLALQDVQIACLAQQAIGTLISGQAPMPMGNAHAQIVPYAVFSTQEGDLIVAVGNDAQFARFSQVLGHPEWPLNPCFSTNTQRVQHREKLTSLIQKTLKEKTCAQWLSELQNQDVPCGPIHDVKQALHMPQVGERNMVRHLTGARGDSIPQISNPIRFSQTPVQYQKAPPYLGEHTMTVLTTWLGLEPDAVLDLDRQGIVQIFQDH